MKAAEVVVTSEQRTTLQSWMTAGKTEQRLAFRAQIILAAADQDAEDVSAAMNAVISALARGALTPGESERIALVVETLTRAIDTTKRKESAVNPLQIFGLDDFYDSDGCDSDEADDGDRG